MLYVYTYILCIRIPVVIKSLPTHGIQVTRAHRKELTSVLAMGEILSSGNFGRVFTVHFLSEGAGELHGVVGNRAVAKIINGEGVAHPG